MSAQSGEHYSYGATRNQIGGDVNIGGPPLQNYQSHLQVLQVTGCTGGDQELFDEMQRAAECACGSEGPNGGPLCAALAAGEVVSQQPFSCMVDLINNYSNCDGDIPESKRKAAYKAFTDVTGYRPADLNSIFDTVDDEFVALVNFNAFYMFAPTMVLVLIIVWLMVGFRLINWVIGLFLTVLVIVILYGFSILYRIHFQSYLNSRTAEIQNQATLAQNSFENSIAYWPQGMFASACAVTCDDSGDCWSCNETNNCPPCTNEPRPSRLRRSSRSRPSSYVEDDEADYEDPEQVRRRRLQRRRSRRT